MILVTLTGLVGGLIGYNLGAKQKPDESIAPVLCRTLEKLVENTVDQSRRSLDMVALDQGTQIDRINAEYVAEAAHRGRIPVNGYIEEPPAQPGDDDLPFEIP